MSSALARLLLLVTLSSPAPSLARCYQLLLDVAEAAARYSMANNVGTHRKSNLSRYVWETCSAAAAASPHHGLAGEACLHSSRGRVWEQLQGYLAHPYTPATCRRHPQQSSSHSVDREHKLHQVSSNTGRYWVQPNILGCTQYSILACAAEQP